MSQTGDDLFSSRPRPEHPADAAERLVDDDPAKATVYALLAIFRELESLNGGLDYLGQLAKDRTENPHLSP